MPPQLPLWSDDHNPPEQSDITDTRPLPLIVAEKWNFPLQYHVVEGEYYYAAQDWVGGMTQAPKTARQAYHYQLGIIGDELSISTLQLDYKAANGKVYQLDFLTDKGLYRLTQEMRETKKSPAVGEIKRYLASAGAFTDAARRNPEQAAQDLMSVADKRAYAKLRADGFSDAEAEEWIRVRRKQIASTNSLRDTWKARGARGKDYAKLTNRVTEVATGRTATHHKQVLKVDNSREGLSAGENALIHVVSSLSEILHNTRDSRGVEELSDDIGDTEAMFNRDEINRQFSKRRPRQIGGAS
jgi:hypothetical protein